MTICLTIGFNTNYCSNSNYSRRFLASWMWLREFVGVNMHTLILENEGCAKKRRFCTKDWKQYRKVYRQKHGEYRSTKQR